MIDKSLSEHRKEASDLSLGLSHEVIYQRAIELINKSTKESGRHLDFGSGQGRLLERLQQASPKSQWTGIDLMAKPEGLHIDIEWLAGDLNNELEFPESSFDSVSAIEIIEHLENPRHVFRELYRILKPGGSLILSTPNNESWRSLVSFIKRGHFVAFTDRSYPAHITALNRKDLSRSAIEAGFNFVEWSFSGYGCVPGLTSLSWQQLSFGFLKGLRFCDNIFMVLQK